MGLVASTEVVQPPNNPPEWATQPTPSWLEAVGGTDDLDLLVTDAEGDTITYSLNGSSAALPANVTLGSNGVLTATASVTAGTTAGIIVDADDGTDTTASDSFSIVITEVGSFIWTGGVEDGSFDDWHFNTDTGQIQFNLCHGYGRPPDYGSGGTGAGSANQTQSGNGNLIDIVHVTGAGVYDQGPVRGGNYSIKLHVKNETESDATSSPFHPVQTSVRIDKYDPASGSPPTDATRQRSGIVDTKFTVDTDLAVQILPDNTERWMSMSIYLASDFPDATLSGFMFIFGLKGVPSIGSGPYSAPIRGWGGITIGGGGWSFRDTWMSDDMYPGSSGTSHQDSEGNGDYWYEFHYGQNGANYSAFDIHYPDFAASTAMLANLNRGAWTDFIFHYQDDTRELADQEANNNGFYDIYMRQGSGDWLQILAIRPFNNVTYGGSGHTYNKGIGLKGAGLTHWEFAIYCAGTRVWSADDSATAYFANMKVGDSSNTFEQMTHDGSSLP